MKPAGRRDAISRGHAVSRRARRGIWSTIVALAVIAAPVSLACKSNAGRRMSEQRQDTLESVGREIAVAFPASATLIGVHRENGIDDLVAVKVEIPAADWPAFSPAPRSTRVCSARASVGCSVRTTAFGILTRPGTCARRRHPSRTPAR
jgi:hypothetical protein